MADFTTRCKTTVTMKGRNYISAWKVYRFGNQKLSQRTCAFGRGPDANVSEQAQACVGTRCSAMPVGFEPSRSSDRTALCAKQRAPLYATHALL